MKNLTIAEQVTAHMKTSATLSPNDIVCTVGGEWRWVMHRMASPDDEGREFVFASEALTLDDLRGLRVAIDDILAPIEKGKP